MVWLEMEVGVQAKEHEPIKPFGTAKVTGTGQGGAHKGGTSKMVRLPHKEDLKVKYRNGYHERKRTGGESNYLRLWGD